MIGRSLLQSCEDTLLVIFNIYLIMKQVHLHQYATLNIHSIAISIAVCLHVNLHVYSELVIGPRVILEHPSRPY